MIESKKKTIVDIDNELSVSIPLDIKAPKEYMTDADYQLISSIYTIINKYKTSSWRDEISISEMQTDVIHLQSLQANLSLSLTHIMSYSESIEEQLKIARSKARLGIKNIKQKFEEEGSHVSLTLDDAKDLSYVKTEGIWAKLQDSKIAGDIIRFVYYAVRDHVQMLDKALHREHRIE